VAREPDPNAIRAARLSLVPGVSIAAACRRFRVTPHAVKKARTGLKLTSSELAFAALTRNGTMRAGPLELVSIARWLEYIEQRRYNEREVRKLIQPYITAGQLETDEDRWRLLADWP